MGSLSVTLVELLKGEWSPAFSNVYRVFLDHFFSGTGKCLFFIPLVTARWLKPCGIALNTKAAENFLFPKKFICFILK